MAEQIGFLLVKLPLQGFNSGHQFLHAGEPLADAGVNLVSLVILKHGFAPMGRGVPRWFDCSLWVPACLRGEAVGVVVNPCPERL